MSDNTLSLFQRYHYVWRQAWRRRKSRDTTPQLAHELQFLPAALELQETPVHPAPRIFFWSIMGFDVVALL